MALHLGVGQWAAKVGASSLLAVALACMGCSDNDADPANAGAAGEAGAAGAPSQPSPTTRSVESFACEQTLSDVLVFHEVCLDEAQQIVPWSEHASPYADTARRAWDALVSVPDLPNGKPTYYSSALFAGVPPDVWAPGKPLSHHPAGVLAMFVDSALSYYAYSGDEGVLDTVVLPFADYFLENGMTLPTDAWASVPYSCSTFGDLTYHGSRAGAESGDGDGYLEPDKVAEVGLAFLRLYEHGGNQRYLETALACADALASQQREGDDMNAPWPFRVDAATGQDVLEPWASQVAGALRLFEELNRIGEGDGDKYMAAHAALLDWTLREPYVSHNWQHYFEDVAGYAENNRNQYNPLELARYLLERPDVTPDATAKAKALIDWVTEVFAQDFTNDDGSGGTLFEPGMQYGAEAISEQQLDTAKMGSHTARFASILALYYEKTGDETARQRAFRSFNWATYCESDEGIVNVGPNPREGFWFSDGYGDYIRHFMAGLGSIPEWAPPDENHLVRSSSIVTTVEIGADSLSYATFDEAARDVLRLTRAPSRIEIDGRVAEVGDGDDAYQVDDVDSGGVVVTLARASGKSVLVTF